MQKIVLLLTVTFFANTCIGSDLASLGSLSGDIHQGRLALIDTEKPKPRALAFSVNFTWLNKLQNADATRMNSLLDAQADDTFPRSYLLDAGKTPLQQLDQPILGTPDRFSSLRKFYVLDNAEGEGEHK